MTLKRQCHQTIWSMIRSTFYAIISSFILFSNLNIILCVLSEIDNSGDGIAFSVTSLLGNKDNDMNMKSVNDDSIIFLSRNEDFEKNNPSHMIGKYKPDRSSSRHLSSLLRSSVCMPYSTPSAMRHLILWTDPLINLLQSDLQELSKHTLDAVLDALQALLIVLRQSWIEFIMRTSKGMDSGRFSLRPLFGTEDSFKQCLDGWMMKVYTKLFGEKYECKNGKHKSDHHLHGSIDDLDNIHEISIEHTEKIFKVFKTENIKHLFDSYQKVFVQFYKESSMGGDSGLHPLYMMFKWMSMSTGAQTCFDKYLYGTDSDGIFKNMTKWKSSDVKSLILALPVLREQWIELAFYLREQNVARCKLNLGLVKEKLSLLKLDADLVIDDDLCYF